MKTHWNPPRGATNIQILNSPVYSVQMSIPEGSSARKDPASSSGSTKARGWAAVVYTHSFIQQCQQLISDHLGLWVPPKAGHRSQAAAFTVSGDNGDSQAPTATCALEDLSVHV